MDVANVGVHVFSERLEVFILVDYEQKTILSRISFVSGKVTNKKLLHRFSCNQVASYCYFDAEIIRLKNCEERDGDDDDDEEILFIKHALTVPATVREHILLIFLRACVWNIAVYYCAC